MSDSQNKLTQEESQMLADQINTMKLFIHCIDLEVLDKAIQTFKSQISYQQNMMIFNPSYSQNKQRALEKKTDAIIYLKKYIEALKEADEFSRKSENNPLDKIKESFI